MNAPKPGEHLPGFECPKCKFFIEITIQSLLFGDNQKCPGCGTAYTMDRTKSRDALQLVQKLHVAIQNLESVKRFEGAKPPSGLPNRR
jgi:predicted RNA-binding Zn-ribbon protein involved in translation (DUF1610 family)